MNIDNLIGDAKKLIDVPSNSPKYLLWRNRAEAFVGEHYDDKTTRVLQKCLRPTRMYTSRLQQQMDFNDRILRAVEFLNVIKETPPPLRVDRKQVNLGNLDSLHPVLIEKCSKLYRDGTYAEAVEKGFKVVRDRLRKLTGYETGSDAFGKGRLFVNGASAENVDLDFQNAVKFLCMAIDSFRNEKSHTSDGKIDDPTRAYEYLALSSLAMHLLDGASIKK